MFLFTIFFLTAVFFSGLFYLFWKAREIDLKDSKEQNNYIDLIEYAYRKYGINNVIHNNNKRSLTVVRHE
jgi:hypothetical protein